MFQEKLSNFEEEKIEAELSEEVIDKEIKENPQGFLNWFENLKNSISEWPKKFFENKAIKNAIIYASIPFAVLSATKQEVKAEDIVSEFVNTPTITQQVESKEMGEYEIKSDDLISVADSQQRKVLAARINQELFAFDKLSDTFNQALKERISDDKNLIPPENYESIVQGLTGGQKIFDFAERMKYKINEANQFFEEMSAIKDKNLADKKRSENVHRILEDAHFNFNELVKIVPDIAFGRVMSGYVHELAHEKEALKQGIKDVSIIMDFPPAAIVSGNEKFKNKAAFHAAGFKAAREYGDFLVNNLRGDEAPSQLLAMMALIANTDAMNYALVTNFNLFGFGDYKYSDIIQYSDEVGVSVPGLTLGSTAATVFTMDNWRLLGIIFGKQGVKIPQTTIAPFYELGDRGPIAGIKFKGVF